MRYRPFGRTGLEVSAMGFGCWPMAGDRYGSIEDDQAVAAVRRALEVGVTCFDTAPAYGSGHAEETLGAALQGRRDQAVIVTKCGIRPPLRDGRRETILREIDESLRRLRTDHVDVYLVHWPDRDTPLEETMAAMSDIQRAGKTRLIGVSNFSVELLQEALRHARLDVLQVGYNLFDRRQEREVFPFCAANQIGVMAYGSLAYGLLTGAFTEHTTFEANDWRKGGVAFGQPILQGENFAKNVSVVNRLRDEVARPKGVTVAQLALAWVLRNPVVTTALVGARVPAEIEENVQAVNVLLSEQDVERIEAIMAGAAGRIDVFRPFLPALEVWT
jgi:aryl-alcohol dehydrogenase-like predicted oxidoreductase